MILTQDYLQTILNYDSITGVLTWLDRDSYWWTHNRTGTRAGTLTHHGYRQIQLGRNGVKKAYKEHRLIWLYMTGVWPVDTIDHINHIRCDNRWCNLQELSRADNSRKRLLTKRDFK